MKDTLEDGHQFSDELLQCVNNSWMAKAVSVAVELEIADLLADGPQTSDALAGRTDTHAVAMHQFLRALTTVGICRELHDDSFELTEMGRLLQAEHPRSLRSWIIWWTTNLDQAWDKLLYSLRTGESARKHISGTEGFAHLEQAPGQASVFNQALVELSRLVTVSVIQKYDFSKYRTIMDVGGGYGELLLSVMKSYSHVSGILFERPHALEGAKSRFNEVGMSSRCRFVEGDFFKSVPGGADAYILKSVIHDWDDSKSRQILQNCNRAMNGRGVLVLIERIIPEHLNTSSEHRELARTDLTMLVAHGAGERTEGKYRELLESTRFSINRVVPAGNTFSVIEAVPRAD